MGYAEYLKQLLRPLGIYDLRESSFSGGEIAALGAALDDFYGYAQQAHRESLVSTARDEGLSAMEELFPFVPTEQSEAGRRSAIAGFLQISGDSFTQAALNRCLAACGTQCSVQETDDPLVLSVRFPSYAGVPDNYDARRLVVESILPCHLVPRYDLNWTTWKAVEEAGLLWQTLAALDFLTLSTLLSK